MVNIDGDGKGRERERQIPNLETPQDFTFWFREDSDQIEKCPYS